MYKKEIRIINILLSVLLALSLLIISVRLVYKYYSTSEPDFAVLTDNIITPSGRSTSRVDMEQPSEAIQKTNSYIDRAVIKNMSKVNGTVSSKKEKVLTLYNKKNNDNLPFSAGNMFPGDSISKNFCVQVSYKNTITVRYRAEIQSGYEKLAEVLKVKVNLINTGKILYDGLMKDMPEALKHTLTSKVADREELYYEITAYLDTAVGNDYQNKDLVADFQWWVEETENLEPPKTGDSFNPVMWILLAGVSSLIIILLIFVRKYRRSK